VSVSVSVSVSGGMVHTLFVVFYVSNQHPLTHMRS